MHNPDASEHSLGLSVLFSLEAPRPSGGIGGENSQCPAGRPLAGHFRS